MQENNAVRAAGAMHRNLPPGSASAAVDFGRFGALRSAANGLDQTAALSQVAQEFEAVFLGTMLKSARAAMPQSGLLNSSRMDMFKDMFDQQIALTMAGQGALGIADAIARQMTLPAGPKTEKQEPHNAPKGIAVPPARTDEQVQATNREPDVDLFDLAHTQATAFDNARSASAEFMPLDTHRPGAVRAGLSPFSAGVFASAHTQTGEVKDPFASGAFETTALPGRDHTWPETRQGRFLNDIWDGVTHTAKTLGVPPEAIAAQAALETGWGGHVMVDHSGNNSHNLFGVKAGSGWRGPVVDVYTHEVVAGQVMRVRDAFRAYPSVEHALKDYEQLLMRPRYAAVIGQRDPRGFGDALRTAGYATDPDYARKISQIAAQIAAMDGRLQTSADAVRWTR